MSEAGFNKSYLSLHSQLMPDGSTRPVLRTGMFDYGSYTQNTIIEIDPSISDVKSVDDDDLYYDSNSGWNTGSTSIRLGYDTGSTSIRLGYVSDPSDDCEGFVLFGTGINVQIYGTSAVTFGLYLDAVGDYGGTVTVRVYNIMGTGVGGGTNSAQESSQSYVLGTNTVTGTVLGDAESVGWKTLDIETATDYWGVNRGSTEHIISFKIEFSGYDYESYYSFGDSQGSNDPYISFTYETSDVVPVSAFVSDGDDVFAGCPESTVITEHTDGNGEDDIDSCNLYIGVGGSTWDITLDYNVDSNFMSIITGSGYLVGTPTAAETGITNGFRLTWTFTIDWDYDKDDLDLDYRSKCDDEASQASDYVSETDVGQDFENDLEVTALTISINSLYDQDHDGYVEDGHWFKGGELITATGWLRYDSSTVEQFYSSYASGVGVQLYYDGVDLGDTYKDTSISGGVYSIEYTPTSASGIDTTAYFDVTVEGIPSLGTDQTEGVIEITSKRDNQVPTFTSYTPFADLPD